jgi:hypothetical protein
MVSTMRSELQSTVFRYNQVYKKLYNREPRSFRVLNDEFVIVNDMQIRISDLKDLTMRLEEEYQSQQEKQRGAIKRIIGWLRKI